MNKYNAQRTTIDNITFHSKAEALRYGELKLLEKAGEISHLELQPRFELQEKFKHPQWGNQRKLEYVADFLYNENGRQVVEDVKGKRTDSYLIKRKLFLYKYPTLIFKEI